MPMLISGLTEKEYPRVYGAIKSAGERFGIKRIKIRRPWYGKNIRMWCQAGAHSIALSDSAINFFENGLEPGEAEAIIAHEFSHIYNRDMYRIMVLDIVFGAPFFLLLSALPCVSFMQGIDFLYQYGLTVQWAVTAYIPLNNYPLALGISFLFLLGGLRVIIGVTRKCERRADREAILKTGSPGAFKAGLKKYAAYAFSTDNRLERTVLFLNKHVMIKVFGSTHPSLKDRLEYADHVQDARPVYP